MTTKRKWKISLLSLFACACTAFGIFGVAALAPAKSVSAAGEEKSVYDNFTKVGEAVGAEKNGTFTNVVYDSSGNNKYGAVPAKAWGDPVTAGDGNIVYTLKADDGYRFNGGTINFEVGVAHGSALYWYNSARKGTDTLGANLTIQISLDGGTTWSDNVYDLDIDENHPIRTHADASDADYRYGAGGVDISSYLDNAVQEIQVRFNLDHFTAEETGMDGWTTIGLSRLGLCLYNAGFSATQVDDGVENFENVYNSWSLSRTTDKEGNGVLGYKADSGWSRMRTENKLPSNGYWKVSYDAFLGASVDNNNFGFRMAIFSNEEGNYETTNGWRVGIHGTALSLRNGNGAEIKSTNVVVDGQSKWYHLEFISYNHELTVKVDGTAIFSGVTNAKARGTDGYVAFQCAHTDDYVANFSMQSSVSETELTDAEYFSQFTLVESNGWKTNVIDDNLVFGAASTWKAAYYNEKLSGNFEISFDYQVSSDTAVGNAPRINFLSRFDDDADGDDNLTKGGYLLKIYSGNAIVYTNSGDTHIRTWNNVSNATAGDVVHVTFRYVNGAVSLKVGDAQLLQGFKDSTYAQNTDGYFRVHSGNTGDIYLDNFRVTKNITNNETINLASGAQVVGLVQTGGQYLNAEGKLATKGTEFVRFTGTEIAKQEGVTYEAITVDMAMKKGASARIGENGGLRWHTDIATADYDRLVELGATFGTKITIEGGDATGKDVPLVNGLTEGDTTNMFVGALTSIQEKNYDKKFKGVGYVTVTYTDESTKTFFAVENDNERSYKEVLELALNDTQETSGLVEGKNYQYEVTNLLGATVYSPFKTNFYEFIKANYNVVKAYVDANQGA